MLWEPSNINNILLLGTWGVVSCPKPDIELNVKKITVK
jgi:hypothetical protein